MNEKLLPLPCPFCGEVKDLRVAEPDEKNIWVACNKCNSSGPVDITQRLAIKKWNRAFRVVGFSKGNLGGKDGGR